MFPPTDRRPPPSVGSRSATRTVLAVATGLAACAPQADGPFAESAEAGLGRYLGSFQPAIRDNQDDGTVTWQFDPEDASGPVCMDGTPFHVLSRDQGNDDVVIYLQGGGACWGEVCATPRQSMVRFPDVDLLDPFEPSNPVAGWTSLVIPYCDGSFLMGDVSIPAGADPFAPREQRGLRNFSAALDLLGAQIVEPDRILLVGTGGGGYGALLGLPVVRMRFPDAEIHVLHDSGAGIARPGDPGFIPDLIGQLGGQGVLPSSCEGCFQDGHITALAGWQLARDEHLVIGDYSTWGDFLIADLFLQIGGAAYAEALDAETAKLAEAWPDRYARFIEAGVEHSATAGDLSGVFGVVPHELAGVIDLLQFKTLRTAEIDGVDLGDWIGAMLAGDGWHSLTEPRDPTDGG